MAKTKLENGPLSAAILRILREAAEDRGWTYTELSAHSVIKRTRCYHVMRGERAMTLTELNQLCEALDLVPWRVVKQAEETLHVPNLAVADSPSEVIAEPDFSAMAAYTVDYDPDEEAEADPFA